ncbi:MAG: reverse transcriptase-like protein [Chloroflexi bacterium]|nr:reverse transcriptase-like protein [Chloroflexota bacterium]
MQYRIWTDGACSGNPGIGAWASIIVDEQGDDVRLGQAEDHTTNNLMELRAVERALEFVDTNARVVVYTDSNLVVQWMIGTYERKNAQCAVISNHIDQLIATKGLQVEWVHVPGHGGDERNEQADRFAKSLIRLRKRELAQEMMQRQR